jgi:imidazolonepropionase-like amidohydrolase
LNSLTAVNAAIIADARLGHLEPGAYGDLLLLTADPLADPSALWEPDARRSVVQAGREL